MALKNFKVVAQLNWNAQNEQHLSVYANSERNARKRAEEIFKKHGAFSVVIVSISEVKSSTNK